MLAQQVSPPNGGPRSNLSKVIFGGFSRKVELACQAAVPCRVREKSASLTSAGRSLSVPKEFLLLRRAEVR